MFSTGRGHSQYQNTTLNALLFTFGEMQGACLVSVAPFAELFTADQEKKTTLTFLQYTSTNAHSCRNTMFINYAHHYRKKILSIQYKISRDTSLSRYVYKI